MKKFFSIILALGAAACGIAAGHLFYLEKFAGGIAMLIMTLIFLSYAMNRNAISYEYSSSGSESIDDEPDGIITDPDKTLGFRYLWGFFCSLRTINTPDELFSCLSACTC